MVLVSHSHKFIFVKPKRVAGTATEVFFQPLCTGSAQVPTSGTPALHSDHGIVGARDGEGIKHQAAEDLWRGHMSAADLAREVPTAWGTYFKFTTVRNPFHRAVSAFFYAVQDQIAAGKWASSQLGGVFQRFLNQHYHSYNEYDRLHVDGRFEFDHVIRFEALQKGVVGVLNHINARPPAPQFPMVRATRNLWASHRVQDWFTPKAIAIIQDNDGWIFDRFGYSQTPVFQDAVT